MFYYNEEVSIEDIQKVELEILLEFDRICKKNGLTYQLFAGTLLGAVRHKGFIPWDDDIDVCLLRKDYEKFVECCKTDLSEKYFLQNCFTDKKTIVSYSKIRKNGTVFENDIESPKGTHVGIYIDVFPMDGVKPGTKEGERQYKRARFYHTILTSSLWTRVKYCKNKVKKAVRFLMYLIIKILPKSCIDRRFQKAMRIFENEDTEYVSHLSNGITPKRYTKYLRKRENFNNTVQMEFCGHMFPGPENYDEILTTIFGDYMSFPPEEERYPHHRIIRVSCKQTEKEV